MAMNAGGQRQTLAQTAVRRYARCTRRPAGCAWISCAMRASTSTNANLIRENWSVRLFQSTGGAPRLVNSELRILALGFLKNRDIRIGIFREIEKILISRMPLTRAASASASREVLAFKALARANPR